MINAEGLRIMLGHIADHPDQWNQECWTHCFAGQTLRVLASASEIGPRPDMCGKDCQGLEVDGEKLYGSNIGVKAALLLGLEAQQAFRLFHADNTLTDLGRIVEGILSKEAGHLSLAA